MVVFTSLHCYEIVAVGNCRTSRYWLFRFYELRIGGQLSGAAKRKGCTTHNASTKQEASLPRRYFSLASLAFLINSWVVDRKFHVTICNARYAVIKGAIARHTSAIMILDFGEV